MNEPNNKENPANVQVMIEKIVQSLVDEPDQVAVTLQEEPGATVLELDVAPGDVGKVIGRHGRTVRAMRNLLSAAGIRSNKRFLLEIMEDEPAPSAPSFSD